MPFTLEEQLVLCAGDAGSWPVQLFWAVRTWAPACPRLGHAELESGRFTSTDELLQKIRAVTLEDVHGLARYLGQQQMITTIVR